MSTPVRVAFCSVDPIGLTTFHAFDPDSFSVTTAIADALIYIDSDGHVQPALATSWERTSPVTMELELRRGVFFHDGSAFDAEDVVATFEAHRAPTPSACGGGILSPIVNVTALGPYRVRIETAFPDGMLVRRLFFGQIYPKSVLRTAGRDALASHPIGTGAYRFVAWNRGSEIVLERNKDHFANLATVDDLHLAIVRQKEWLEKLTAGEIDVAFNLDAHDAVRAKRQPGVVVASRSGSVAQSFLLRNQGALADVRVRRAMNHAIHRRILVDMTEHGMGSPQRGVATSHEEGFVECEPHRYSTELSRRLLAEAGYEKGLTLRGLVCETSTSLFYAVREFLSRVGIELVADIVPLAEWMGRVVWGNLTGKPYDGDFAVTSMGNPLAHALFLQFANVFSQGPGSLTRDPEYDAAFLAAATVIDPEKSVAAVQALERYASEQAYMLFTVQQFAHAAWREGFSAVVPLSGLPTSSSFWALRANAVAPAELPLLAPIEAGADLSLLLEGTSHAGTFYLPPAARFGEPVAKRIWSNIVISEERWRLQNEPLLRELVSLVDAKDCLSNVLDSTHRVAIVGYSDDGRRLFFNRGYQALIGDVDRPVMDRLPSAGAASWPSIRKVVDAEGSWSRSVDIEHEGRSKPYFLAVTQALDDEGVRSGYTFVFSDFSGEEERIKNGAIRTILDNVPYALFACDRDARVLPGYSNGCKAFFCGATVEGAALEPLLGLSERDGDHFRGCYDQVVADVLPAASSLAQLPKRLPVGDRICDLSGAVTRADDGQVSGVLFTLLDVTELAEAEREAERLGGVVHVLAFRSSFEAFVRRLDADLASTLDSLSAGTFDEVNVRRMLHTAKGDFGQYKLRELATLIHDVEDAEPIRAVEIQRVRTSLRETLEANAAVWNIRLEAIDPSYALAESGLRALEDSLAGAQTLEEARALFAETFERLRQRSVGEIVGPIEESCQNHAARVGKRVQLVASGLDRRAPPRLERALGTLAHLARNAIDHALESPGERGEKAEIGTIGIAVREEHGALVLEISDDGRGIDCARVAAGAVAAGALTQERADRLTAEERIDLIFLDGLSTCDSVSESSGRGVGMAAVKEAVVDAGGTLVVETVCGRGTRFVMRLPMARRAAA
jgi:ABC-type transport system substrate-binding protein/signal transduction histidine kinase